MRKNIVLKGTLICFGLTDLMWVAPETGYAQIDPKAIVGIWLLCRIPLGMVMMGK